MNFSDHIIRDELDIVYVKRSENDMRSREEWNSNLSNLEQENGSVWIYDRKHLYSTPCRDVRIGESIFDENKNYVAYRVD